MYQPKCYTSSLYQSFYQIKTWSIFLVCSKMYTSINNKLELVLRAEVTTRSKNIVNARVSQYWSKTHPLRLTTAAVEFRSARLFIFVDPLHRIPASSKLTSDLRKFFCDQRHIFLHSILRGKNGKRALTSSIFLLGM